MKNEQFERIIKEERIIDNNNNIITLRTKEQFIDNLLKEEDITIIEKAMMHFNNLDNDEDRNNHIRLINFIQAIKGIEHAESIELAIINDVNTDLQLKQLKENKIRYIKYLANWLFE